MIIMMKFSNRCYGVSSSLKPTLEAFEPHAFRWRSTQRYRLLLGRHRYCGVAYRDLRSVNDDTLVVGFQNVVL